MHVLTDACSNIKLIGTCVPDMCLFVVDGAVGHEHQPKRVRVSQPLRPIPHQMHNNPPIMPTSPAWNHMDDHPGSQTTGAYSPNESQLGGNDGGGSYIIG